MALIPFAEKKLIPAGINDPGITPVGIILHVDAGNAADLYEYFRYRSGGIESHGHIRKDGHLYQYRDTQREADANYRANSFVENGIRKGFLSFETQGYEFGEWTDAQIATIKRVIEWGHEVHHIPLRVCEDPYDPGIGYHTLFGAPSAWTPVSKSCPGPDRKKQFYSVIEPWLENPEEEDVPYSDWPEKDKSELANDVADVVVDKFLKTDLYPRLDSIDQTVKQALKGKDPVVKKTAAKKAASPSA